MSNRYKGLLMSLFGVFILSPDSLLIRLTNLNDLSLIFYRGALPPITIILFLIIYYKGNFAKSFLLMGKAGIIYALLYSLIFITFVYSIQHTAVANTLVLIASAPIFTAILSVIFLKENPKPSTWIIIFFALISIVIIGWGSFITTGFTGDVLALITGILMAACAIVVRYYKNLDLVPACVVGCLLTALYALPFSPELTINFSQIIYLSLMCFIILPIPFIILTIAPRLIPAPDVTLVFLLESILGSLWVWMIINEQPPLNTLIGGIMLLCSVFLFVFITAKEEFSASVS